MSNHITVRLPWHDDGWNGKICKNPAKNSYCTGSYSCSGELLRKYKEKALDEEQQHAGKPLNEIDYIPPCSQWINTYGEKQINHIHIPPDFLIRRTKTTRDTITPNTTGTWPYLEVADQERSDGKSWLDFDIRESNIERFFEDICTKPNDSLAFFYLYYDNPINSENRQFLLVGASEISEIGEQPRWEGMSEKDAANKAIGNQVWCRWIRHTGKAAGCHFPHHALLQQVEAGKLDRQTLLRLIPEVPERLSLSFRYVCKKVSSPTALVLLELLQDSLLRVRDAGVLKDFNYEANLTWLNKQISRCWKDRGRYPGLGAILEWLGHSQGTSFYRRVLMPLEEKGQNPLELVLKYLKDPASAPKDDQKKFKTASEKWKVISVGDQEKIINVLSRLSLSPDHLTLIFSQNVEDRAAQGLISRASTILENPYLLSEELTLEDTGVPFEVVDQGICPSDSSDHERLVEPEDSDRLRALAIGILNRDAQRGHTWVPTDTLIAELNSYSKANCPLRVDQMRLKAAQDQWASKIGYDSELDGYYLTDVREDEKLIASFLNEAMSKVQLDVKRVPREFWKDQLSKIKSAHSLEELRPIIEDQASACDKVYLNRVSIINGSAGTGKTSAVRAVLKKIADEDKEEVIQLAFTGRAAFILEEKTGCAASTIHSFLNDNDWLYPKTWLPKRTGGSKSRVLNFVIDEASMLDVRLLAQFLRAINWDEVRRVIFVGDVYQLPPIGPGKPFADILAALSTKRDTNGQSLLIGNLDRNIRQLGAGSQVLTLASAFRNSTCGDINEALNEVFEKDRSEIDLKVVHFNSPQELIVKVRENIFSEIVRHGLDVDEERPYQSFDKWLGMNFGGDLALDRFQILAPFRKVEGIGVDDINLFMQKMLRGGFLNSVPIPSKPNRVGEFTTLDKILITRNRDLYNGWDHESNQKVTLSVTNGQLAYVIKLEPKNTYLNQMSIRLKFKEFPNCSVTVSKSASMELCELGYATTVHKAQGSEFDITFFILPFAQDWGVSKELIYTALTRCKSRLVLFTDGTIEQFKEATAIDNSDLRNRRTTRLFSNDFEPTFRLEMTTEDGKKVSSKSECLISNALHNAGVGYEYNQKLLSKKSQRPRWPDFILTIKGVTYYWEHAGMLSLSEYYRSFEKKKTWYEREGLFDRLLVSHELDGFRSDQIKKVVDLIKSGEIEAARKIFDPNVYRKEGGR